MACYNLLTVLKIRSDSYMCCCWLQYNNLDNLQLLICQYSFQSACIYFIENYVLYFLCICNWNLSWYFVLDLPLHSNCMNCFVSQVWIDQKNAYIPFMIILHKHLLNSTMFKVLLWVSCSWYRLLLCSYACWQSDDQRKFWCAKTWMVSV